MQVERIAGSRDIRTFGGREYRKVANQKWNRVSNGAQCSRQWEDGEMERKCGSVQRRMLLTLS